MPRDPRLNKGRPTPKIDPTKTVSYQLKKSTKIHNGHNLTTFAHEKKFQSISYPEQVDLLHYLAYFLCYANPTVAGVKKFQVAKLNAFNGIDSLNKIRFTPE